MSRARSTDGGRGGSARCDLEIYIYPAIRHFCRPTRVLCVFAQAGRRCRAPGLRRLAGGTISSDALMLDARRACTHAPFMGACIMFDRILVILIPHYGDLSQYTSLNPGTPHSHAGMIDYSVGAQDERHPRGHRSRLSLAPSRARCRSRTRRHPDVRRTRCSCYASRPDRPLQSRRRRVLSVEGRRAPLGRDHRPPHPRGHGRPVTPACEICGRPIPQWHWYWCPRRLPFLEKP